MNVEEDTCLIYLLKCIIKHQVYFDCVTDNHTHHDPYLETKNIMKVNDEVIKLLNVLNNYLDVNKHLSYINFILG